MSSNLVNLIINILGGVLAALLTSAITYFLYKFYKNRIHIKRIINPKDKDLDQTIGLYEALIVEEYRSSVSVIDIVRWLEEYQSARDDPNHALQEYWLVGKLGNQVVSFMYFQYYLDSKFMFISYYGVDKQAQMENNIISKAMLENLRKRISSKELKDCRGILFEIAAPDPKEEKKLNRHKRARKQLFMSYARQLGFTAYELDIDYIAPKNSLESDALLEEEFLSLMYIPLKQLPRQKAMLKTEALEILHFIYLQLYGDMFMSDEAKDEKYKAYVSSIMELYEATLPDEIELIS